MHPSYYAQQLGSNSATMDCKHPSNISQGLTPIIWLCRYTAEMVDHGSAREVWQPQESGAVDSKKEKKGKCIQKEYELRHGV